MPFCHTCNHQYDQAESIKASPGSRTRSGKVCPRCKSDVTAWEKVKKSNRKYLKATAGVGTISSFIALLLLFAVFRPQPYKLHPNYFLVLTGVGIGAAIFTAFLVTSAKVRNICWQRSWASKVYQKKAVPLFPLTLATLSLFAILAGTGAQFYTRWVVRPAEAAAEEATTNTPAPDASPEAVPSPTATKQTPVERLIAAHAATTPIPPTATPTPDSKGEPSPPQWSGAKKLIFLVIFAGGGASLSAGMGLFVQMVRVDELKDAVPEPLFVDTPHLVCVVKEEVRKSILGEDSKPEEFQYESVAAQRDEETGGVTVQLRATKAPPGTYTTRTPKQQEETWYVRADRWGRVQYMHPKTPPPNRSKRPLKYDYN